MAAKKARILLVEDDVFLAQGWQDLFELLDYDLRTYPRGLAALQESSRIAAADLVISDYYLPDINGIELIQRARQLNPGIRAMLLTGSRDKAIAEAVGKIPGCELVYKPVNIDDLERRIEAMFATTAA